MRVRACGRPGVSAGEEGTVLAAGGRGPSTLPPSMPPRPTQLAASPERVPRSGLRLDREPGLPGEGGHPRWVPQLPSTHCIRPAHAGPSLVPICPQEETGAQRPRRWWWGVSPAARAHNTLRQAGLCTRHAWVRWAARAGRAAEEGTFLPVCRRAQAGAGSSWPLPVRPPHFRRAILAGVEEPGWHSWSFDVASSEACLRAQAVAADPCAEP